MENTTFIMQPKTGSRTSASPAHRHEGKPFGLFDGVLLVGFMAAFLGLVVMLAK
jgi:hypothetical protein